MGDDHMYQLLCLNCQFKFWKVLIRGNLMCYEMFKCPKCGSLSTQTISSVDFDLREDNSVSE